MNIDNSTAEGKAYLDLIKRLITNYAYLGGEDSFTGFNPIRHYDRGASKWRIDPQSRPMTLLSAAQLEMIEQAVLDIEQRNVPGDLIEAGIWRGGAIIFMRALLNAYGIGERQIIAADSFEGIPQNTAFRHDPVDAWQDRWSASLNEVKGNIERLGLLDDRIEFLPGFFADSLGAMAHRKFALIRLDSDSHDSVMTSLEHLYPRLSPGGIIIIDDWHLIGCRFAINAYREKYDITEDIVAQDGNAFWIKRDASA